MYFGEKLESAEWCLRGCGNQLLDVICTSETVKKARLAVQLQWLCGLLLCHTCAMQPWCEPASAMLLETQP